MEADVQQKFRDAVNSADSAAPGHSLSDWLSLHEVTAESIEQILKQACRLRQANSLQESGHDPAVQCAADAWHIVKDALCEKFPAVVASIELAQSGIEKDIRSHALQDTPPFTLDRRPDSGPLVSLQYQGTCADLICLAHEFAHAIQIQLTTHQFINPILRELAAFIGEHALLSHLKSAESEISKSIDMSWQQENLAYLGTDVDSLLNKLDNEHAPYSYRWNYPIARILATRLHENQSAEKLWSIFLGDVPLTQCIEMAKLTAVKSRDRNYLPPLPGYAEERPAINAYRVLGMMCLLDVDYWQGPSDASIAEYYKDMRHHLGKNTTFVALDKQRRPMGYATWNVDTENLDLVTITKLSAPFGDHLELLRRLRMKLPENAKIMSHHERSGRKSQVVC